MDPWVDFIGVPKEKTDDALPENFQTVRELAKMNQKIAIGYVMQNWHLDIDAATAVVEHATKPTGPTYLELVRPFSFANGEVEALFFDEFNRSPKKIRNAVMELIQFGSVNGHKFPNLRFVWAAINPDDDEQLKYDVEACDPAHLDRFHCSVQIPYKPNAEWFRTQYGQRPADAAIQWWDELTDDIKKSVSPRRLQYALDMFVNKGDIRDVLPANSNVTKLLTSLKTGPITEKIDELMANRDEDKARTFLENENNFAAAIKFIGKSDTLLEYFAPLMPHEKLASLMSTDDKLCGFIIKRIDRVPAFHKISRQIMNANLDPVLVKKIRRALTEDENLAKAFAKESIETPRKTVAPHSNKNKIDWGVELETIKKMPMDSGTQRISVYDRIVRNIPEKLSESAAAETLKLLNQVFSPNTDSTDFADHDKWKFASIIIDPSFEKLFGVVNHCLLQIHKQTDLTLTSILKKWELTNSELFKKIMQANMQWKLPADDFRAS